MKLPFKRTTTDADDQSAVRKRIEASPDGMFEKCAGCRELVYVKEFERNWKVCPRCQHHHPLRAHERVALLLDDDSFEETDAGLRSVDFLNFTYLDRESKQELTYASRLDAYQRRSGLSEGAISGTGRLQGRDVVLVVMDLKFLGASCGSVIGEKVTRAIERARDLRRPLIVVSASGGMRQQEGLVALMQMAKTSAALTRLGRAGIPFISIMTDQTYGGVSASWGALGDVILGEPGTKIGFAGPRVIEQTIRQKLPLDAQTADFQLQHGMVDMVVPRGQMKDTVATLLRHLHHRAASPVPLHLNGAVAELVGG